MNKLKKTIIIAVTISVIFIWNIVNNSGQTSDQTEVKIQLNWFADGEHAYLYYGKKLGYFEDVGLDLKIVGGKGSELSAKLLSAGTVDFGLVGPDALLGIVQQGGELKSLGIIYDQSPVVIYSLKDANINKLSDLAKKKVGVLIGSNTFIQYMGFKNQGLIRDVIEVPVNGISSPILLNEKKIDALTYYGHYVSAFEKKYSLNYNQIKFSDFPSMKMFGMSLATSDKTIKKLGVSEVDHFYDAVKKSIEATLKNPELAIEALAQALKEEHKIVDKGFELSKLKSVLKMICNGSYKGDCSSMLDPRVDEWKTTTSTVKSLGVIRDDSIWQKVIFR